MLTDDVATPVGLGCVNLGANGRLGIQLVHRALDIGVRFFDTADAYGSGSSERVLGRALRGRRDAAFVATKAGYRFRERTAVEGVVRQLARPVVSRARATGGSGPSTAPGRASNYTDQDFSVPYLRAALEASLRRLGTDYVDLYQLHGPRDVCHDDVLALMSDLRSEGKIRGFGVGLERLDHAMAWLQTDALTHIQVPFGVLDPGAADDVIPAAAAQGTAVVARGIFAGGLLLPRSDGDRSLLREGQAEVSAALQGLAAETRTDPRQLAAWFVTSRADVSTVLVGTSSARHLEQSVGYLTARPPAEVVARLNALMRPIRTTGAGARMASSHSPRDSVTSDVMMSDVLISDVVVVGSGPCGAMAAHELVQLGVSVTLLDAGTRPVRGVIARAAGNTLFKWAEPSGLRSHRQIATGDPNTEWKSSLSLGGLSNYWSGSVPRMSPDDFSEGALIDERFRWPISYRDLEAHYRRVELAMKVTAGLPLRGLPAPIATFEHRLPEPWTELVRQATDHGHAIGVMPQAKGSPWMLAPRPTGFSSYQCLLKPMLADPRLRLVTAAFATGITVDDARATVEYIDRTTGERRLARGRAVVVAAGTLDSTKLLLQSRSADFPDGLGNASGLVGRYLHDHPRQWWPARLGRPMPHLTHPIYIGRQPHGEGTPLMAASLTLGMVGAKARIEAWYGGRSNRLGAQVLGTMMPSDEFTVRLADRPPAEDPADDLLEIDLRYDDLALKNMEAARDRFSDLFAQVGLEATPEGPFHQIRPGSSVHYGGTIRMHADPAFGVLDQWNRVHDAPHVVVCDASCFTTGPEKNPTLTAMAIASRAAHHLAAALTDGPDA